MRIPPMLPTWEKVFSKATCTVAVHLCQHFLSLGLGERMGWCRAVKEQCGPGESAAGGFLGRVSSLPAFRPFS